MVAITVRNVSGATRDELAERAARSGRSLQEYLRGELDRLAQTPAVDDVIAQVRARKAAIGTRISIEEILSDLDADRR